MNKLLVTTALCAALFSSIAALTPRPAAATPSIPIPPPLSASELKEFQPAPLVSSSLRLFPLAPELSAYIYTRPMAQSGWTWVICVVQNIGLRNSGTFQTLLTKTYVGTPTLPGLAVAIPYSMDIPAVGYRMFFFAEHAPLRVSLTADFTHLVPEYNEANNEAILDIVP